MRSLPCSDKTPVGEDLFLHPLKVQRQPQGEGETGRDRVKDEDSDQRQGLPTVDWAGRPQGSHLHGH